MKRISFSVLACASVLLLPRVHGQGESKSEGTAKCRENMERIYAGIQEYRKEHKALPGYLHELVPKHVSESAVRCPVAEAAGAEHPFPHLADPKLKSDYIYEFSARETGTMWGGGNMTMAEWKGLQMSVVGGVVPILRCWHHEPKLNISFDGKFYESPESWENLFTDKVSMSDLSPAGLRARMLARAGDVSSEEAQFAALQAAAMMDEAPIQGEQLTDEQKERNARIAKKASGASEMAEKFLKDHPESAHAAEVRNLQRQTLLMRAHAGDESARRDIMSMVEKVDADGSATEDERFQAHAMVLFSKPFDPNSPELKEGARELIQKFPKREEPYMMLLQLALGAEGDAAEELAKEVLSNESAPESARRMAEGLMRRMSIQGKPIEMSFTALDGSEVDVSKMKGKVVLIDFWATWCGPCIAELPNVKAAYDKLHSKGFEIVGISFDNSKSDLEEFVKKEKVPWVQFFDGKGWNNKFGQQYGINSIPTMWLVNKEGVVVDVNARADLASKVQKLLEE